MAEEQQKEDNVVYIGNKPFMNYVTSALMQFSSEGKKEVIVKARGKFITRAVDVATLVKKKLGAEIKDVKIEGEEMENKNGKKTNVSTIEIVLTKE